MVKLSVSEGLGVGFGLGFGWGEPVIDHHLVDVSSDIAISTLVDVAIAVIPPPSAPRVFNKPVGGIVSHKQDRVVN